MLVRHKNDWELLDPDFDDNDDYIMTVAIQAEKLRGLRTDDSWGTEEDQFLPNPLTDLIF